jgi:hypothetical protein
VVLSIDTAASQVTIVEAPIQLEVCYHLFGGEQRWTVSLNDPVKVESRGDEEAAA